jgi:hypothetical protein
LQHGGADAEARRERQGRGQAGREHQGESYRRLDRGGHHQHRLDGEPVEQEAGDRGQRADRQRHGQEDRGHRPGGMRGLKHAVGEGDHGQPVACRVHGLQGDRQRQRPGPVEAARPGRASSGSAVMTGVRGGAGDKGWPLTVSDPTGGTLNSPSAAQAAAPAN